MEGLAAGLHLFHHGWITPPASPQGNGPGQDDQQPIDRPEPLTPPNRPPIPGTADPQRFSNARNNFTRFAGSGGSDRASLGGPYRSMFQRHQVVLGRQHNVWELPEGQGHGSSVS
jgi:hypothetical protein